MSIISPTIPKYQYSRVRFFEREHGTEFLRFELAQMKRFADARKQDRVEIDGYVSWCRPPFFILLPTTTTPNGYIICKAEDGQSYPDLNQFSTLSGRWTVEIIKAKPTKILLVSDIHNTKPDFGKIKPDIAQKEFVGILFDQWRNIRDTTEDLIAQSMISSPTLAAERAGGFTLTLANYSKKNALIMLMGDLRRFIPADLVKNRSLSFQIPELGVTTNLPKLGWEYHVSNLESLSGTVDKKLDRMPNGVDECSITLLQKTTGPIDFDLRGVIKSDYPIVLEELIEKTRVSYHVNPEIYKFILATRMSAPTVSSDVFEQGISHSRKELSKFAETYEMVSGMTGNEQFLDLGYKGKPLSVNNLALSLGRSQSLDKITSKQFTKASDLYLENLDTVFKVQELWGYDRIPPAATVNYEERQLCLFLEGNESTIQQISEEKNIPLRDAQRLVESLLAKNLVYEPKPGSFLYVGW